MAPTSICVHNARGEIEVFEAYQCRITGCTRYYAPKRGYFDIAQSDSMIVENPPSQDHVCPTDREPLVVIRFSNSYFYECPVEGCDYLEAYTTAAGESDGSG